MIQGYKFRIYPNKLQAELINKHFGAIRWIYNYGLDIKIKNHQNGIKTGKYDIKGQLPQLKKDIVWLQEISAQSLQMALLNLNTAFTNFFRSNSKFPRFKSKKNSNKSYSYCQGIHLKDGKVYLPKIGWVKIIQHRKLFGNIKTCTVSQTPTGKYYISILQNDLQEAPQTITPTKDKCIGIDVGIRDFAICSNGEIYGNPKWIKAYERRLEIRARRHSKKKKGSKNKDKSRLVLAGIYEKVSNQRLDYIHKITHSIVSDNQATNYAIENLNVKGMMSNRKLSKAIGQVGWGMFRQLLKYKSGCVGKTVIEIGRFEPSSKMCCKCGNIKQDLKLSDRIYKCNSCGNEIDRDLQASINIKNFAYKV